MARAGGSTWTTGGNAAIELPDPELIALGVPVRVGDDLVLIGPDGSRFVVDNYFRMDPPPVLTAGPYRLPPGAVELAAGDHIAHDGEQLAAAPRTVSAKAVEDFTNAIAQGRDFSTAVDELAAAQIRQATARGVPLDVARKAAAAFANELALNLGGRMNVTDAIADAERGFAGALKALTATDKPDALLQALTTGQGLDGALSSIGVSGRRGAEALGNALNSGEQQGRAIGKGQSAETAHDKAGKSGNPLLDALVSGQGLDKVAALLGDPNAAQRFAEMLQQGLSPDQAMSAAKQAAESVSQAQKSAEAASKGGLDALASGKSGGDGQLAQAFKQAGLDAGGPGPAAGAGLARGGSSVMEALASGQGVAQVIGGSGQSFEQAFGNALAEGGSIAQAQGAADKAATASGKVAADSTLGQIAGGNAGALSGSRAFEAAVGEALARGTGTTAAIGEATTRAALAQQASQKVEAAPAAANPFSGGSSPFQSSPISSPNSQAALTGTGTTGTGAANTGAGTNASVSFVTQVSASLQSATSQVVLTALNSLQAQVSQANQAAATNRPPPPVNAEPVRSDAFVGPPNAAPILTVAPNATMAEDGTLTILYQASDPDGAIVDTRVTTLNGTLLPVSGLVAAQGLGTLVVAPAAHQFGTGKVTLSVTDGKGATTSRDIDITVTPVNDAPTITGTVSTNMAEDPAVNDGITVAALLGTTESDIENEVVGIAITAADAANGTWQYKNAGGAWTALGTVGDAAARVLAPDAGVRFLPNQHWNGATTLTFRPWDQTAGADGNVTLNANLTFGAAATATMVVTPVNDAPTITATAATITRGQSVSLNTFLESNEVDADDTPVERVYTITAAPQDGALYRNGLATTSFTQKDIDDGLVRYQHFGGYLSGSDSDSFAYSLSDGTVQVAGTFALTVDASTTAPRNIHAYQPVAPQSLTSFTYLDVTGISTTTTGEFTFTNVSGPFTSATLRVTAGDVDYFWGERDLIKFNGHQLGYLNGASDVDSVTTFSLLPSWINPAGTANIVSVQVTNANILPIAWAVALKSAQLSVTATPVAGVTFSAFDVVGGTVAGSSAYADARAVVQITTPGNYRLDFKVVDHTGKIVGSQSVSLTEAGTHVVNGSPSYVLSGDSGTYQVQACLVSTAVNSTGQTIKAQSFAHVKNVGPNISDATLLVPQGADAIGTVVARLGHSDANANDSMTYTLLDDAGGRFELVAATGAAPEIRVKTALNYAAATQHIIQVKVTDAAGGSWVESFTIGVTNVNQAPTGADMSVYTAEDAAISAPAGFSDLDGDALTYALAAAPGHGGVSFSGSTWTYTPEANWSGTDTFQISAADAGHAAVVRTVTVTVAAANDAPTATNAGLTVTEDNYRIFTLADFGFTDGDGDALAAVQFVSGSGAGTLQTYDGSAWNTVDLTTAQDFTKNHVDAGYLRYVPVANATGNGQASYVVKVSDGTAWSTSGATLTMNVTAINDAPAQSSAWFAAQPEALAGLIGWWDASDLDGDGVQEGASEAGQTGGIVTTWTDKSGYGHHASAPGGASSVSLALSQINGKAALAFDGVKDRLVTEAWQLFATKSQPLTVFAVFESDTISGQHYLLNQGLGNDASFEMGVHAETGAADGTFGLSRGDGKAIDTAAGTLTANAYTVSSMAVHASGAAPANVDFWINGTAQTEAALGAGWNLPDSYNMGVKPLDIGVRNKAGSGTYDSFFGGHIAELLIYNQDLSDSNRQAVENYLSAKYGMSVRGAIQSPTGLTIAEDTALVFSNANSNALTIADVDNASLTTTVSVGAGKGSLTVAGGSGATITNDGSHTVTIAGTAAQINAALNGLSYLPTANANGADYATLSISTSDGTKTDLDSVAISVTAVNDAPSATLVSSGSAIRFDAADGSNDYVTLTNAASTLDVGASGTMELWVRRDTWNIPNNSTGQSIIDSGIGGGADNALYLSIHREVGLHFRYGGETQAGNNYLHYQDSDNWAAGSWHHIATTWNNGTLALYADGQLVDSYSPNGSPPLIISNPAAAFSIGKALSSGDQTWASGMSVDDVRIWGSALSQADIVRDMTNAATAGVPQGYWKFDEGTGAVVADSTGHYDNATLTNATWTTRYIEDGSAIAFMPPITLGDVDGTTLTGATVTITGNFTEGDQLNFVAQNGISGTWNAATHALTLSGNTGLSHAAYKAALESVTFSSSSDNPTANGAMTRTISITVNDGGSVNGTSAAMTTMVNVVGTIAANAGLRLDGADDIVTVNGINLVNQSFSWESWAYRDAANNDFIFGQGVGATNQGLIIGYYDTNFQFGFHGDASILYADTTMNQWVHWAGTYDAATNQRILYRNGTEVVRDIASADYQGSGTLYIGDTSWSGGRFGGLLDEVRMWSDVRTAAEIADNYTKRLAGTEDNLAALWHFDEGAGNTGSDSSPNSRDATLANGATWENLLDISVGNNGTKQFHTLGSESDAGKPSFSLIGANGGAGLGSASIDSGTGIITYTAGATDGNDSVSYQITDGGGATSVGVVDVRVA
jgi:hypothetical protein